MPRLRQTDAFFCLNVAPARPVPGAILERADLIVANSLELEALGSSPMGTLFALTLGADGALLLEDGVEVARAAPPPVQAVDGTAAGDAFTACLVVSLLEGRDREEALRRACAGGAIAASRPGAQPSLPTAAEVDEILDDMSRPILLDCDPGHDDAIALLLALASPELELLGVTTVAGNQTLEKTTANALRVLEFVGRGDVPVAAGADRPLARELFVAAYVHGESGLDGPALPEPQGAPLDQHAVDFLAERILGCERPVTLVPVGPLTNVALLLARYPEAAENVERIVLMGGAIAEGNVTPAAEFNIYVDPEAAWRVFRSGLPVTMIGLDVTHQALMTDAHAERLRASGPAGRMVAELYDFFIELPPAHIRRRGRTHPRRRRGRAGSPARDRGNAPPLRGRGLRVEPLPRPDGRRPLAPDWGGAERGRRRGHRRGRLPRAPLRAH